MKLIGLVGFAGSGKSTVGQILFSEHGYETIAFADCLKDVVSIVFGWDRDLLQGDTKESREFRETIDVFWSKKLGRSVTPRQVLIEVGTRSFRENFDSNIWVHALERKMHSLDKVAITDVRFLNEIACVKSNGGKLLRVKRGAEPEWYFMARAHSSSLDAVSYLMHRHYPTVHVTEWEWIGTKFDKEISNDGSIDDLRKTVAFVERAMYNND
jgi:hypothetical protein